MATIKLWGFSGSTYVRTVRMLLAEKGVTDYEQVPVDVLKGEPKSPEHRQRHPFGKVPVVDVDGFRVIETPAITRYLDAVLPGTLLVPHDPKDVARMDMVVSILDSYGYAALIGGVVAYHLFPDFVGGKNEKMHHAGLEEGKKTVAELMKLKGSSAYLAGDSLSVADIYLAPIVAYITLTPHKEEFLEIADMGAWWKSVSTRESFRSTQP